MILQQAIGQVGMSAFAQLEDDRLQENALVKVVEQIAFLSAPLYVCQSTFTVAIPNQRESDILMK